MKRSSISVVLKKCTMPTFILMIVLAPATRLPRELAESAKSPKWVTMQTLPRDTMRSMQINTPGNNIVSIYQYLLNGWREKILFLGVFCCLYLSFLFMLLSLVRSLTPIFLCSIYFQHFFSHYIFFHIVLISIYFLTVRWALSMIVKTSTRST